MFWNQYIYRLRVSVRTWDTLFWTWVFPLLLATLFFFAFSRLDSADAFAPIPAAVVADEAYQADPAFSGTLDAVSAEGEGRLLLLTRAASVQEADALLDKGAVTGYFRLDAQGVPCLIVKEDGLNQTILNRIFGFHTIFHNSCKFQSLSKFDKFISDFDFQIHSPLIILTD